MHVAPTDTTALLAGVREMTGSVDERVTTLVGHLTDKFRALDAAVAHANARPQPGFDAVGAHAVRERLAALEQGRLT